MRGQKRKGGGEIIDKKRATVVSPIKDHQGKFVSRMSMSKNKYIRERKKKKNNSPGGKISLACRSSLDTNRTGKASRAFGLDKTCCLLSGNPMFRWTKRLRPDSRCSYDPGKQL